MTEREVWWRVEDITYAAPVDELGYPIGLSKRELFYRPFQVMKHTPKGVWVLTDFERQSFVLRAQGGKRLCHPTKEDALASYIRRKERQIRILSHKLSAAREFKLLAELALKKEPPETIKRPLEVI